MRLSAAERRRVVLEAAARLFSERGFSGTRTGDLSRASGISDAMLFKLFRTKRALYEEMVRTTLERWGEGVFPREAAEALDDAAVLEGVAGAILENARRNPSFVRLLLFSALEGNEFARLFSRARSRKVFGFVSGYIRKRMRQGGFRKADPNLAALGFLGMVFQYVQAFEVFRMPGYRRRRTEEVAREIAQFALRGLAARRTGRART